MSRCCGRQRPPDPEPRLPSWKGKRFNLKSVTHVYFQWKLLNSLLVPYELSHIFFGDSNWIWSQVAAREIQEEKTDHIFFSSTCSNWISPPVWAVTPIFGITWQSGYSTKGMDSLQDLALSLMGELVAIHSSSNSDGVLEKDFFHIGYSSEILIKGFYPFA